MIRLLYPDDRNAILEYAYRRESENLFLIGSLRREKPFEVNRYYGLFDEHALRGICTFFGLYGNLVIHTEDFSSIDAFVDTAVCDGCKVESVAAYRKFGEPTIARLRHHNIHPLSVRDEIMYILPHVSFVNFTKGEEERARPSDVDACVLLQRTLHENIPTSSAVKKVVPISERERAQIDVHGTFVIRRDGMIISKANIHGVSKHFVQIGGVITHPKYQKQGLAKQVVSALCTHYFSQGIPNAILNTWTTNEPAIKVYRSIGFTPIDEFVIAEYAG